MVARTATPLKMAFYVESKPESVVLHFSLCAWSGVRPGAAVRGQRIPSGNRLHHRDCNLQVFSAWSVGVLAVFLLSCIGYPSQSGFTPKGGRSQAWDVLHYANVNGKSLRYEAQRKFSRIFRDAPGIVLSDIEPPYLNALLPKPFVAAPIDGRHDYCYSQLLHYAKPEAVQLVANSLGHATPVYALLLFSKDVNQDIKRLPVIQGYSWKRSKAFDTTAVIMTLTKDAPALTFEPAFLLGGAVTNEAIRRYPLLQ